MKKGSGCEICPVHYCDADYRGSRCAALRDAHGLGDPLTQGDMLRTMSDSELAALCKEVTCPPNMCGFVCTRGPQHCEQCWLEFLRSPAEQGGTGNECR